MSTQSMARKDANDYAFAKLYYGEGAGTRRKLIKATVEARKMNPEYQRAFDQEYELIDMSVIAQKVNRARMLADRKMDLQAGTKKFARWAKPLAGTILSGATLKLYYDNKDQVDDYILEKVQDATDAIAVLRDKIKNRKENR